MVGWIRGGGVDALGRGDWMDPPSRTGWMD